MNQPLIITGQVTLIGLLVGLVPVWLNHLLANTRDAKNKRANYSKEVIDALTPELDAIIQTSDDCRLIMTDEAYNRHDSAIRKYMIHLSFIDKFRLNRLWHSLAMVKLNEKQKIPFYTQYADCGSLDKRREIRPILRKRIQDIISFVSKRG